MLCLSLLRFFAPPEHFNTFTEWARHLYLDPSQVTCVGILSGAHKYIIACKEFLQKLGIPVDIVSTACCLMKT